MRNRGDMLNRAEALELWHRVNLGSVLSAGADLSARQMAILTTVYMETGPHTVRSLAQHLDITISPVTRALDTLGRHGLVDRGPDPADKRSVLVHRTAQGSRFLSDFAERIRFEAQTLKKSLKATKPNSSSSAAKVA